MVKALQALGTNSQSIFFSLSYFKEFSALSQFHNLSPSSFALTPNYAIIRPHIYQLLPLIILAAPVAKSHPRHQTQSPRCPPIVPAAAKTEFRRDLKVSSTLPRARLSLLRLLGTGLVTLSLEREGHLFKGSKSFSDGRCENDQWE